MKTLGYISATIIALGISSLIKAFVGYTLYNWFLLPLGAPALGMGPLYGAIYFAQLMLTPWKADKDAADKEYSSILAEGTAIPVLIGGMSLVFGYVLHLIIS